MKKRYYIHCPLCHKRMRKFSQDFDQEHRFYYCTCGQRITYFTLLNAVSEEWPNAVFDAAVRRGVLSSAAQVR